MKCCSDHTATPLANSSPKKYLIALAGNPNVGKSTVFNALTGSKQKIANYPGVTVEKKLGTLKAKNGFESQIIDLPGCYSLEPQSQDEEIATKVITGGFPDLSVDIVVVITEAAKLDRGLRLVQSVRKHNPNVVLVLNMMDELEGKNLKINSKQLQKLIGLPVVEMVATKKRGISDPEKQAEADYRAYGQFCMAKHANPLLQMSHGVIGQEKNLGVPRRLCPI